MSSMNNNKIFGLIAAVIILLVGIFVGAKLLSSDSDDSSSAKKSGNSSDTSVVKIEQQVREIFYIPKDEKVINIASINSEEALKNLKGNQPSLLENAKVGDYYIVFENRAILYRESENKIISYAPIVRTNESTTTTTAK